MHALADTVLSNSVLLAVWNSPYRASARVPGQRGDALYALRISL